MGLAGRAPRTTAASDKPMLPDPNLFQCIQFGLATVTSRLMVEGSGVSLAHGMRESPWTWGFPHFQPSFFSKPAVDPVSGGFPERRIPGKNGGGSTSMEAANAAAKKCSEATPRVLLPLGSGPGPLL